MKNTTFLTFLLLNLYFTLTYSQPTHQFIQTTSSTFYPQTTIDSNCPDGNCTAPVLFPLTPLKIIGLVLIVVLGGLANSTGIGGGVILTPILLIFFAYSENTAISVVYSLIFGAALGNLINLVRRRDPQSGKPLIDYNISLLCMPLMILGTNIGVIFSRIAAPVVIVIGIVAVSIYNLLKVYKKAKKQYKEETRQNEEQRPLLVNYVEDDFEESEGSIVWADPRSPQQAVETDKTLQKVLREEDKLFPEKKIAILSGLLLAVMIISLVRGTDKVSSIAGIPYCSAGYWGAFAFGLVVCALFAYFCQRRLKRDIQIKRENDVGNDRGGFELEEKHMNMLSLLSLIAGVLAGLLGIGGGTILSPTFLSIGVPPQTLAATAGFFIVQTSFISLFQASLYGDVLLYEQGVFFVVALVGSFGVSLFLSWLVKKYKRSSLLLFLLVGVVTLSVIVTPTFEIWTNYDNMGRMVEFNPVC